MKHLKDSWCKARRDLTILNLLGKDLQGSCHRLPRSPRNSPTLVTENLLFLYRWEWSDLSKQIRKHSPYRHKIVGQFFYWYWASFERALTRIRWPVNRILGGNARPNDWICIFSQIDRLGKLKMVIKKLNEQFFRRKQSTVMHFAYRHLIKI